MWRPATACLFVQRMKQAPPAGAPAPKRQKVEGQMGKVHFLKQEVDAIKKMLRQGRGPVTLQNCIDAVSSTKGVPCAGMSGQWGL